MDQNLNTPQDQVDETKAPSVNTGDLNLAYSPFQSTDNYNQFQKTNQSGQDNQINLAFTNFIQPQNMDFSQMFRGRMNFNNQNQFGPQYSDFRPQNVNFRQQQQFFPQQYGPQQYGPQQFRPQPRMQYSPQQYGPQFYGPQQFRPMPMHHRHQQFEDFNNGMKFNPFDMLKIIPQFMQTRFNQFDQFNQFNQPQPLYQFRPQDYDYPDAQDDFSPEYEQDYPQDMPPQTLPPNRRFDRPERPDVTERPQLNDRPDPPANSAIARLQAAVQRANNGGRPLTVVQFGDSHVAANTLPESIKSQLNMIAPTDFQAVAKGGVSSNYPSLHAQEWLEGPIKGKQPDLVIISFGTNDANAPYNDSQFKGRYQKLINEIKQRSPNTAIMVVSAADGSIKGRPLQGIDGVVNAQRELAEKNGLMFLDLRAKMGGPGSINRWRQEKLAAPDLVHFSPAGYRKIGEMTVDAIRQQAGLRNRR